MQINFTPIRSDHQIKIDGETVYIKSSDGVKRVDFSHLPNGKMITVIDYISSAERVDGDLTVTLMQPMDRLGNPVDQEDFETTEYEEVQVNWKTWLEIEAEQNKPKPPTTEDRLEAIEQALLAIMEVL